MSTEKKIEVKQKGKVIATRKVSMREVAAARALLASIQGGAETVKRFSLFARLQHFFLFVSVSLLGITGLAQTFSDKPLAFTIIKLSGGIHRLQFVHHIFAVVLGVLIALHIYTLLDGYFVQSKHSPMVFEKNDLKNLSKMFSLMQGYTDKLPRFDRYKPDEKFMYWVTAFSVLVSLITGLFIWFPVQATFLLPGSILPLFLSIHRWQAILLVVVVLFLHTFQVLRKKNQVNIFTGDITLEEMKYEHPVELQWLERIALLDDAMEYPVHISLGHDAAHHATQPVTAEVPAPAVFAVETQPPATPEAPAVEAPALAEAATPEAATPEVPAEQPLTRDAEIVTQEVTNVTDPVKIVTDDLDLEDIPSMVVPDDSKIVSNQILISEEPDETPAADSPPTETPSTENGQDDAPTGSVD